MNEYIKIAEELIDFIYRSPSPYQNVELIVQMLEEKGAERIKTGEKFIHKKQYYTVMNESGIIAFRLGSADLPEHGFKIITAHNDSPCLKIKPRGSINDSNYQKLCVEGYGGGIIKSTWLDRPLAAAGIVCVQSEDGKIEKRLLNINEPIAVIPNAATAHNREAVTGYDYNIQTELSPVIGGTDCEEDFKDFLAERLGVKREAVLSWDLSLYEYAKGEITGIDRSFVSSPRLDDQAMVHAGVKAFLDLADTDETVVLAVFNNEEVGSRSPSGADGTRLQSILDEIMDALGYTAIQKEQVLEKTIILSADAAHGAHPNFMNKSDLNHLVLLGEGPALKWQSGNAYATDFLGEAYFKMLCGKEGVNGQVFVNRSDMPSGSTVGPVLAKKLGSITIDLGNPIWGMHSLREVCSAKDHYHMYKLFLTFYKEHIYFQ